MQHFIGALAKYEDIFIIFSVAEGVSNSILFFLGILFEKWHNEAGHTWDECPDVDWALAWSRKVKCICRNGSRELGKALLPT